MAGVSHAALMATVKRAPSTWTFTTSGAGFAGSLTPSQANMSDNNASTGWATASGAGGWIQADLGEIRFVTTVNVRDCNNTFGGFDATYTNGCSLQISHDGSNWTTVATLSGHTGGNDVTYSINSTARYVRVFRTGNYAAASEFKFS